MYLTINSEFKPFTYDELVKPLQDYTEAYNKVEEQYSTLAQQTEAWKNIATQENSPEAYAMYKKYSDELNTVIEDFSRGMNIQNRNKLLGLKSRYASEITPIANAYEAFQKANTYRDAIKVQDPSAIFNIDKYYSIDNFLNGQNPDNNFISGDSIQANIASQVLSNSYIKYNELINAGHSKRSAANIVSKGDWVDESSMLEDIYASSGIASREAADRTKSYVDKGIEQGISTFYVNTDEALLNEEIARAKAYKDREGDRGDSRNPRQTSFKLDDTLLDLYDAFGLAQTRTDTFSDTLTETSGEWSSTTTKDTTKEVVLTRGEKLNAARKDRDIVFGSTLVEKGLDVATVMSRYYDYKDLKDNGYGDLMSDFEEYTGYFNSWKLAQETSPSMTFIEFLDEVKNENSNQNE